MEFHIARSLREKLDLDDLLFSYTGNLIFANLVGARKLAKQLNDLREPASDPSTTVHAGSLFAMGLIDELSHAMVARYREEVDPDVLTDAIAWLESQSSPEEVAKLLLTFTQQYPNVGIYRGEVTAKQWLSASTKDLPNREAALEELLLLWLAQMNPAFTPFQILFADPVLEQNTVYKTVTPTLQTYFATRPPVEIGTLLEALVAPMLTSPDSLTGQLDFIREHWVKVLGEDARRVLLAIDTLKEEDIAIWLRFHPPGSRPQHGEPGWEAQGFVGDEYVGFDEDFVVGADGVRRPKKYAKDHQAPLNEYEAFSQDHAWMPNVVLMAKSTYVWLEQLSKKYQRHIYRLDQIPEEELRLMADRGMTGLWLIGLWERSTASRTIKRLRGQSDAVASAYSLKEYRIADDLGGTSAYESLRDKASHYGIRLASDMVPNHMGIDSTWVIEHPDWFISRPESPFPAYSFEGPDLSTDSRVELKIDDHYYDQTDAAVAFRLRQRSNGETRFIYHGNDGTTFAWNDTAQLDYSKAFVREQVIQTIFYVARLFPIIRFDAAMTLAKRHVQRLWFPLPGVGGSIPSRAESAISNEEFDALMPHEFWREVVDRVAVEVPGTLLLAEAFWLLEGYFVRTLGMHRVYNSAFMNMVRDEENAKYRSYLKKTIEFDPDILGRYVNFMSNPDEKTAGEQFGDGDKFFGSCTLLATLPGLPMFAHGQIEGFTERYGMDFKQARIEESPNQGLMGRYQHEIAPLLKKRYLFAGSQNFVLYDFWNDFGSVDENVFAYSNRVGDERAVILYNNAFQSTRGTIHISAASMDKGSGSLVQRSLVEGLALSTEDGMVFAYRDPVRNLEYLYRASELNSRGLTFSLQGYGYVILQNWRQLRSTAEYPWDRLCDALNGSGVHSVDDAISKLRLRPLHEALRQAVSHGAVDAFVQAVQGASAEKPQAKAEAKSPAKADAKLPAQTAPSTPRNGISASSADPSPDAHTRITPFVAAAQSFFARACDEIPSLAESPTSAAAAAEESLNLTGGDAARKTHTPQSFEAKCGKTAQALIQLASVSSHVLLKSNVSESGIAKVLSVTEAGGSVHKRWAVLLAWVVLDSLPEGANLEEVFDQLHLRSALADIFSTFGIGGEDGWRAAAKIRVLLSLPDGSLQSILRSKELWQNADVRWLTGVSVSDGITYVNKEQVEELLPWLSIPGLIGAGGAGKTDPLATSEADAQSGAALHALKQAGYRLDVYLAEGDLLKSKDEANEEPKPERPADADASLLPTA